MCIKLPASACVVLLRLHDRHISISIALICRRFPEYQDSLRSTCTHLGTVLGVLRPAEAVGLVVFTHDISCYQVFADQEKAVLLKVHAGFSCEVAQRGKAYT